MEVAAANFVGFLVEIGRILDEMKLPFDTKVGTKVEVDVGCAAVIAVAVIGVGCREAAAYLEISNSRAGRNGLCVHEGCSA
jgi:hypothetical protein